MKKILSLIAVAGVLFAACEKTPEGPKPVELVLTNAMVQVNNELTQDALVTVDNTAKTVEIELVYADKVDAAALDVEFVGLPEGITAQYEQTFNYADGATQTVAFSNGESTLEYVVSVVVGQPDPAFASLALNGVAVANGEARLKGTMDLTKVVVTYTVTPADTKVYVGTTEVANEAEVDFSDKANGVTFTLKCGEVEKNVNVKVVTSGIANVQTVWAKYTLVDTDWFDKTYGLYLNGGVATPNTDRSLAMDDKYVYVANHGNHAFPAIAIDITNPSNIIQLKKGPITGGTHPASVVKVVPDGNSTRLIQANLCIGATAGAPLKVYTYDSVDAEPREVLNYSVTAGRYGDRFTFEGTWQDGKICFVNQAAAAEREALVFAVKDGKVNPTPATIKFTATGLTGGSYGAIYKYSDTEYMWAGTAAHSSVQTLNGTTFTEVLTLSTMSDKFVNPMHGVNFFEFNDQKYMAFVKLENTNYDASLNIIELNYETLAESLEKSNITGVCYKRYLGSDGKEAVKPALSNGNSLTDACVRVINGETYIAANSSHAGISLFKLTK